MGCQARDFLVFKNDPAPIGFEMAGDQIEQRGLAGAVRADNRHEISLPDRELGAVDRLEVLEGLVKVFNLQHRRPPRRGRRPGGSGCGPIRGS